jgi:hypothetical protein
LAYVDLKLSGSIQLPEDLQFEQANLSVGDDKEVATATGRVKERQLAQVLMELSQPLGLDLHALIIIPELIKEQ